MQYMLCQKVLWPQLNVTITYGTSHSHPASLPADIPSSYQQWATFGEFFYILKPGLCYRVVELHSHACTAKYAARMSLASEER